MTSPLPPLPARTPEIQAALDADHLRLLEIGFYISGVLTALRVLWLLFIVAIFAIGGIGAAFAAQHAQSPTNGGGPPTAFVFAIIAIVLGVLILLTLIFAAFEIFAGYCLQKRKNPIMIQVVAAFYCLSIPWGTALGAFTFIVLNRPSVKPLFS